MWNYEQVVNTSLPYISLSANNPSRNPFYEQAFTDTSAWFLRLLDTQKQVCCCFAWSSPLLRGGTETTLPPCNGVNHQLPRSLQWNTVLPLTSKLSKVVQTTAATCCTRYFSAIEFLKGTALTGAKMNWPYWLLPSNTRWPVPAKADYDSSSL